MQKILLWLIGMVVVVGAVIAAWLLFMNKSSGPSANTSDTNGQYSGGSNTTDAQIPSSGQASGQQVSIADLDKAYGQLFEKLLAKEVAFTPVNSSSGAMGEFYALYADDATAYKKLFPAGSAFSIDVSLTDITNDGAVEAIVLEDAPGYCGTGGCQLDIYKKDSKGKWTKIFSVLAGPTVGLSNTLTNGYLDLFLTTKSDPGYQSVVGRYAWDGSKYGFKELVAAWDGENFKTP